MKIRGMSYQKGIFFVGERTVSCAYEKNGQICESLRPLNILTVLSIVPTVFVRMPIVFQLFSYVYFALIFIPKLSFVSLSWDGLPYYFILYYIFGTHFMFPRELRKYHGAEHKVFSDRGMKKKSRIHFIKKAKITNRYCSTNIVVIYFIAVITLCVVLLVIFPFAKALMLASYTALLFVPLVNWHINTHKAPWIRRFVLTISYWLQEKWTTSEPDEKHLLVAITAYANLAKEEFPQHFYEHIDRKKKEHKKMAIVDISVIPVGTQTTQLSSYVASIHKVLKNYEEKINYELTPMSTIIEGELPVLFEVIEAIHEVPFQNGAQRVVTNIRIDDRRDKEVKMEDKVKSVKEKLQEQ